jgi:O-antigen ligase
MTEIPEQDERKNELAEIDAPGGRFVITLLATITIVSVLLFGAVDSGTLALLALLFAILISYWGWVAFRAGRLSLNVDKIQWPLLALGVIGLIQLLPLRDNDFPAGLLSSAGLSSLSLDPYATRFFLVRLLLYIIFFATALAFINTLPRLRAVAVTLIIFGGLLAFYSILQQVEAPSSIYGLREPPQALPFGTYVNRHHFAALMEMTLGLTLGILFAGGQKRNRWLFLIAAASVMAIAIVLTGSRGGMLGFVGLLALIAAASMFRQNGNEHRSSGESQSLPRRLAIVAGGSAFFLLTIGLTLFLGGADSLLRSAGINPGAGDFTSGRLQFWQTGLKIFRDHPIIGAGLDAFGVAYSRYDPSNGAFRVEQAHNDYLQILADAGILGFLCVAAFIFLLFREGLATIRTSTDNFRRGAAIGALAGCFGILIHSFFDFPLRTPANGFMFLLLVVVAVSSIDQSRSKRYWRRTRPLSEP